MCFKAHNTVFVFLKKYNKIALKDVPGSIHILLEGKTHNKILIVAIGYRCSSKAILHVLMLKI